MVILLESIIDKSWFWLTLWIVVFVIALVVELTTEQFVSIWFSGGAVISLILAIFEVNWIVQIILFVVTSAILVIITQIVIIKNRKKNQEIRTNTDSLVGQEIVVTRDISVDKLGEGKVRDVVWSLQADKEIKVGEKVKIIAIKGNRLIVSKLEEGKEND